tara:strand:- start:1393 stop:2226 length:834 start_codon:yes stop_codon:yes gene_type:complete
MNEQQEKSLRKNIRDLIRYVKQKRLAEEKEFKQLLSQLIEHEIKTVMNEASVADVDPTPNKSTGINVLEELLKKIIPILETDYKSLTTNKEQRVSFRSHIINAVVNTLTPARINTDAGEDAAEDEESLQEVEVTVGDKTPESDDMFIDIRTDAEKAADVEETDPREEFGSGIEGADETGRNMAYESFKKVETNIIDSYELLSNDEDQELFYDYLIANLKLYFDKFEVELAGQVDEPTNQAYDSAAGAAGEEVEAAETEEEEEVSPDSLGLQEYIDSL